VRSKQSAGRVCRWVGSAQYARYCALRHQLWKVGIARAVLDAGDGRALVRTEASN
jgi:hypothetical protein